jgi:L-amino acid N-acyltransferase YncA
MPEYLLQPLGESDDMAVLDIFNHYIEHSFAAYPEHPVPHEFFGILMNLCKDYPTVDAKDGTGALQGFGMLRPHSPLPVFARTAELTCFVAPGMTGKGIGSQMLSFLEKRGKKKGIATIIAGISSLNEGSIIFHARHGFTECGRFRDAGMKWGILFDIVWMQKMI